MTQEIDKKPNMLMFVGVVGQGKSTFAEENQELITAKYGVDTLISSDNVIEDVALNLGKTYSEVFKDTIDLANKFVQVLIGLTTLSKQNILIDRTNLTKASRKSVLDTMKNKSEYYKIAVVFNDVKDEELKERLKVRGEVFGKVISPELLKEMQDRFEYPTMDEGFDAVLTAQEFYDIIDAQPDIYGEAKFA